MFCDLRLSSVAGWYGSTPSRIQQTGVCAGILRTTMVWVLCRGIPQTRCQLPWYPSPGAISHWTHRHNIVNSKGMPRWNCIGLTVVPQLAEDAALPMQEECTMQSWTLVGYSLSTRKRQTMSLGPWCTINPDRTPICGGSPVKFAIDSLCPLVPGVRYLGWMNCRSGSCILHF